MSPDSPGAAAQLCSRANPPGCRSGAVLHLRVECETVSAQHPVGQVHLGQLLTEEGGGEKKPQQIDDSAPRESKSNQIIHD